MNISGHSHDDEVDDDKHIKSQARRTIDEFILIVDQSAEWMTTYVALDDVRKMDIYQGIWLRIEETLRKNDINRFKELDDIISHLNKALNDNEAPLKYAYSIILSACRYDRQEIMKHFLDKVAGMLDNTSDSAACDKAHDKMFDFHKAFYYAIRSNNVDLLETLIESTISASTDLYDSLAKSYELLRSKNVNIEERMKIFVENRLVRERFLRDIAGARHASMSGLKNNPDSVPEVNICRIIYFIIDAINRLSTIASFDNQRVSIALFIARNIRVLKGQLKSTVNQRPWTEMEFCLSRYSCLSTAERKHLHLYLVNLINEPKNVFGITDTSSDNDEVLRKIKQYVNGDLTIDWENIDDYEAFHNDYELLKDEYSLNKMLRYIESSLSVSNPESQTGKLIIQRTLHVIGEYVKNSLASPNLSTSAQETFISNLLGGAIEDAPSLRDSLSHVEELHVLFLRNRIENRQTFFTQIHEDLKKAYGVVVHVSCHAKMKRFKRWCEDIVRANDTHEFKDLCEELLEYLDECRLPGVEAPEIKALTKAEILLTSLWNEINENEKESMVIKIKNQIDLLKDMISLQQKYVSNKIMDFNANLICLKQNITDHMYECRLNNFSNDTSNTTRVTEKSKMFIKNLSHAFLMSSDYGLRGELHEIATLLDEMYDNVEGMYACKKIRDIIFDVMVTLGSTSYASMFRSIEEFKDKIKIFGPASTGSDCNTEEELDDAFEMAIGVLKSKEAVQQFQSLLEKRKIIHQIKLKVSGSYDGNRHQLAEPELCVLHETLFAKRLEGKKLLSKTPDYYGEFLAAKREMKKFAGSFLSENKDVRSNFIDIFNQIKSQFGDCTPEFALNKTVQEIEEKKLLTNEEYVYLSDKFRVIKNDHEARLNLASFFDCNTELGKEEYDRFVAALNVNAKAKTDLQKLYKSMSKAYILESLTDSYGALVNTVKNKGSTAEQICNSYVNFLASLKLDPESKKLLSRTIIKNKVLTTLEKQFSQKLNWLKEILGNVKTREAKCTLTARYRSDVKLQAVVEMLLLDLCNISKVADTLSLKFVAASNEIPLKFLEKGFLYLDGSLAFLTENSFRNYLAHGDALIDALPCFEPTIAVISCAILFCEEGESFIRPQVFRRSDDWEYYLKRMCKPASVKTDFYSCCEEYLSQCCNPDPLFTVTAAGNKQSLEILLKRGEDFRTRDNKMRSLLHVAAENGHKHIVEALLDNGVSIDAIDKYRRTSLHLAAGNGHCPVVETLLKNAATVDALDASGRTPLHHAALSQDTAEVVHILLKYGANCNARCNTDLTALHVAALSGNLDVIKLLVVYKANDGIADDSSNTPLHIAVKGLHNNAGAFRYLLRNGRCYSKNYENSLTAALLGLAVLIANHTEVDAVFKKRTASVVSETGIRFLLSSAAFRGNVTIVEALLNNGANVNDVLSAEGLTALHYASGCGHSLLVKFLLERKAKVDQKCYKDLIPLHYAAQSGYFETVKVLVEDGKTDVNTSLGDGTTALHFAVARNHINIVKYLVANGAHKNPLDDAGESLLHYWAYYGNNDLVVADYLIDDLKIDVNSRTKKGFTPLFYAVNAGSFSTVKYFVDKRNAQLDARSINGTTLLHYAARRRNLLLMKYLIEKIGENVNEILGATDVNGMNVLQSAVMQGHAEIVKTVLETRNDESFVNSFGVCRRTPLCFALCQGRASLVETLLEYGADVEDKNNPYLSPLDFAVIYEYKTIAKILLKHRADPNRKALGGRTPLLQACIHNGCDIIDNLLEAGADVNTMDDERLTPLHVAAMHGCLYTVNALVNRGACVDAVDKDGRTPLQYARHYGNPEVHELLVSRLSDG